MVSVLRVVAVMASGVDASGCAVGSYNDGTEGCKACPAGLTTLAAGAESAAACVCERGSFGTYPVMHFPLTGALTDTIAEQVMTHDSSKGADAFASDTSRGQVLDLTSSESKKIVLNSAVASQILDGSVWTMSVWFKPVSQSQRVPILVRYDKSATPRGGFEVHYETTNVISFRRYDGAANNYEITKAITESQWTHLTFVSSENAIFLYTDGQLTDSKTCTTCGTTWPDIQGSNHILGVGVECHADKADSSACPDYKNWHDYAGYLQDLRIHDRALTAAEIPALVSAPADSVCASCPSTAPYTDPAHGATSAGECAAVTGSCGVVDVTSDRKIIYEKTIHKNLGSIDANWAGYLSWVSSHAGYTVPTVSQMDEFVATTEFADLITASGTNPGGVHALSTDEWTPVYDDDGITKGWYQVGSNSRGTNIGFDANTDTTYTGWYFATFLPSDVTSGMVKVASFHTSSLPYTLTFSAATMADVLVISGSHYRYVTNLPVSGAYTITVSPTGESSFLGANSFGVTSGGGNVYSLTYDFTGKDTLSTWQTYATEIGGTVSFESYQENTNIAGEYLMWSGSETVGYFELPLPAGYDSVTITYGSGGWEWGALSAWSAYADKMYVKLCLCSSGGNECTHASCDVKETIDATYQVPSTSTQTMSYTAGQVLRVEEKMLTVDMNMIIVLKNSLSSAISGTPTVYTAPQVVVKYNAIVCPSDTDTEPTCDEGVSVFSYWSIRKC